MQKEKMLKPYLKRPTMAELEALWIADNRAGQGFAPVFAHDDNFLYSHDFTIHWRGAFRFSLRE